MDKMKRKNEKIFYAEPIENKFSLNKFDLVYEINVDDVNALALFATTLNPKPEITEWFGYSAALATYYSQNDNELKDSYLKLVSDTRGSEFLCTSILLCLLEKDFRENGINENSIEKYNHVVEVYKKQLDYSNLVYGDKESKGKKL